MLFDLDDTVLDRGELREEAYSALFRLRAAGLRLVACTGRPTAWAELVVRQWPVDAALAENGAIALLPRTLPNGGRRVLVLDPLPAEERALRRRRLRALADSLLCAYSELGLSDDVGGRISDCTFDIGEHRVASPELVQRARAEAERQGARTFASSIHLHLSFDAADKATGAIDLLRRCFEEDPTAARRSWAYVGDSGNDAPAFAAFQLSFGVANVRDQLAALTLAPRFVASCPAGRGFAEIAARLALLRQEPPRTPGPSPSPSPSLRASPSP